MSWWQADEAERARILDAWARLEARRAGIAPWPGIDDVGAAMLLSMDDAELAAHVRELCGLLGATPQGDDGREALLVAFGRACAELNARKLPYGGEDGR